MSKKMLIDAGQPEETRVVVVQGNRVEEFEFESSIRKQLKGNIYLAKVTRVEPSLQAAFVEYGGNRHGFLPLSEIHPDYYQIPLADREALLAEEAADAAALAEEEDREEEEKTAKKPRNRRRRRNRKKDPATHEANSEDATSDDEANDEAETNDETPKAETSEALDSVVEELSSADANAEDTAEETADEAAPAEPVEQKAEPAEAAVEEGEGAEQAADEDGTTKAVENSSERLVDDADEVASEADSDEAEANAENDDDNSEDDNGEDDNESDSDDESDDGDSEEDESVESVGADDDDEQAQKRRQSRRRAYRIQEVIRRRQILLVQVVKEERGNKGAALTTYLSIAGRYCVLMPNTARGGGISRKITQATDRKRLKSITSDLEVPTGMGLIVRTAGAQRTKAEIKRDFDYLIRLWDNIRELTLKSVAPCLIYEESNLIQRAIRDMYSKDVDTVMVQGDDAYRQAKDYMKMLMPSHAKNVQPYRDRAPLFLRYQVETQLEQLLEPVVQLKSGGYLVINPTEALVSIDVNSGRSTKEKNVEDTAHATNLEAAEEVARQLRMRDLAGLIVIDFIDMEDNRNRRSIERKMKEALKSDRARIQVGRISHFGLMEMSRQRLGSSLIETYTTQCPHCSGTGTVRTIDAAALKVMRAIEEEAVRGRAGEISATVNPEVAVYILNHKRTNLSEIEAQYDMRVLIVADSEKTQDDYELQKTRNRSRNANSGSEEQTSISATTFHPDDIDIDDDDASVVEAETSDANESNDEQNAESDDGEEKPKRRRRRRRRRRKPTDGEADSNGDDSSESDNNTDEAEQDEAQNSDKVEAENAKEAPAEEAADESKSEEDTAEEDTAEQKAAEAEPEKAAEPEVKAEVEAPADEPAEVSAEPEVAEEAPAEEATPKPEPEPADDRPKKRGWWQRRS